MERYDESSNICSLNDMKKRIKRVGDDFLKNIFSQYIGGYLDASDALLIYNNLGLSRSAIYVLAISHGLRGFQEEGFEQLLSKQIDESKKFNQCLKEHG